MTDSKGFAVEWPADPANLGPGVRFSAHPSPTWRPVRPCGCGHVNDVAEPFDLTVPTISNP